MSMQHDWQQVTTQTFQLGESPFWHQDEQALYWVDVHGHQVLKSNVCTSAGTVDVWDMPSEPGCIAPAKSGGFVIALRDGVYRAREWKGSLKQIARFNYDTDTTRFNDGKCDPMGRFWAGTVYEPKDKRRADLYCVDARGGGKPSIEIKAHNAITANGIAWSADQKTVYWADTGHEVIHAWEWDAKTNSMRHHRVFKQFDKKPAGWKPGDGNYMGRPDGAAVDVEGNYYVAMFEGQRILKLSPKGEILQDIATPTRCPTMPCFGGDDMCTLYITTARKGRPDAELASMPMSGAVFSTRVKVPGLPVNFFVE